MMRKRSRRVRKVRRHRTSIIERGFLRGRREFAVTFRQKNTLSLNFSLQIFFREFPKKNLPGSFVRSSRRRKQEGTAKGRVFMLQWKWSGTLSNRISRRWFAGLNAPERYANGNRFCSRSIPNAILLIFLSHFQLFQFYNPSLISLIYKLKNKIC